MYIPICIYTYADPPSDLGFSQYLDWLSDLSDFTATLFHRAPIHARVCLPSTLMLDLVYRIPAFPKLAYATGVFTEDLCP